MCGSSQLAVSVTGATGAAGTIDTSFGIADKSSSPCTLKGRPALGLVAGSPPTVLSPTVQTGGQGAVFQIPVRSVRLTPGSAPSAGFEIQSSDVPVNGQQSCPEIVKVLVTVPGSATAISVAARFAGCDGPTIAVSAIVAYSSLTAAGG